MENCEPAYATFICHIVAQGDDNYTFDASYDCKLYYTTARAPLGWKSRVTKEILTEITKEITDGYNRHFETCHAALTAEQVFESLKITSKMNDIVIHESGFENDEEDDRWSFTV